MPIPDFQSAMRPLLAFASDGRDHTVREALDALAKEFHVSEEERRVQLPSGRAELFTNRVAWAKTHLRMAGLVENRSRGVFRITERGRAVLQANPTRVDMKVLATEPVYLAARSRKKDFGAPQDAVENERSKSDSPPLDPTSAAQTPEEIIEEAYQSLRENLADEILERLRTGSPEFFERLVVELLVKMGYGGSRKDAGAAIGRSGDEGVDGIIKEDRLGLDVIYVQAKRWQQTVGRPEIQKFAGALQGFRAKKGIFITTSEFSREAKEYADRIDSKIILLGGDQVAQLMMDAGIGVSLVVNYEIQRIDNDFFMEE